MVVSLIMTLNFAAAVRQQSFPQEAPLIRAVSIVAPRRIELTRVPIPLPGPGEVRIRVEGCGVCGSNLPIWQGRPWFNYPLAAGAPGHEGWGRIDALGEATETF